MSTKTKNPVLINAAQMAKEYPATFSRPTQKAIDNLTIGHFAKVSIQINRKVKGAQLGGERFWVQITKAENPLFEGRVDNDLLTDKLKFNDIIAFHADNIYNIEKLDAK